MPTFSSIPIHPTVRRRLEETTSSGNSKIPSPYALLTRNPNSLAQMFDTGEDMEQTQVDAFRNDVAEAMIAQTSRGMRVLRDQEGLRDKQDNNSNQGKTIPCKWIPGVTLSVLDFCRLQRDSSSAAVLLSTGCRALDEIMAFPAEACCIPGVEMDSRASLVGGYVYQVHGPSGSGKTQLALQVAIHALGHPSALGGSTPSVLGKRRVMYLSSNSGHTLPSLTRRYFQMYSQIFSIRSHEQDKIHKRIVFQGVASPEQLIFRLHQLEEHLQEERISPYTASAEGRLSLLVVDSISGVLWKTSGQETQQSQQKTISRLLQTLASSFGVVVLVTNGVSSSSSPASNMYTPALGTSWQSTSQIHLALHPIGGDSFDRKVQVHMLKHPFFPCESKAGTLASYTRTLSITSRGMVSESGARTIVQ